MTTEPGELKVTKSGNVQFVMTDLKHDEFEAYYNGFSNDTLWPLLHFMLGFFKYSRTQYTAYCQVNEFFASKLAPLLKPDDIAGSTTTT